ncbi:hypothetical protein P0082_02325 [Candidatus Haliotispira prima]|uniref:Uncharacterized protein n=1 Tax=Candidatus Haliotispira prima TaxID=3034016 RepID=A0ABY8MI73_9SPIO|nr:hypothetical protein P0082_02325 [Candidatus Haliotispira prima]
MSATGNCFVLLRVVSWGGTLTLRKLLIGFNLSLFSTLLFSIALPFGLLGNNVFEYFRHNVFGIGIMLLSFIAINVYFSYNWSLFSYLEKGDWYSLLGLLRTNIFEKKKYNRKQISYFIEVAIQLNNLELLRELFEELQARAGLPEKFSYVHGPWNPTENTTKIWKWQSAGKGGKAGKWSSVKWWWKNRKNYRLGRNARKCLCEYAIEFGLPYLIDDPGHESEVYFGDLRDFTAFQQKRYVHKYKWAELFYAIALLVQGKVKYAAHFLEQLLVNQPSETSQELRWPKYRDSETEARGHASAARFEPGRAEGGPGVAIFSRLKAWRRLREDALLQLVSIQLLEDLQGNPEPERGAGSEEAEASGSGRPGPDNADNEDGFVVDRKLIDLRRAEIQKIYDSPKHWSSYLVKEQNQNIAITMIRQLISSAYEQQLRPAHQAYLAGSESRNKAGKPALNPQP